MKSSSESPTLFRIFAIVSTVGQRGLLVGLNRLLLLKAVGSRAAARARPEALRPCALAVLSIARQTVGWVSFVMVSPMLPADWLSGGQLLLSGSSCSFQHLCQRGNPGFALGSEYLQRELRGPPAAICPAAVIPAIHRSDRGDDARWLELPFTHLRGRLSAEVAVSSA